MNITIQSQPIRLAPKEASGEKKQNNDKAAVPISIKEANTKKEPTKEKSKSALKKLSPTELNKLKPAQLNKLEPAQLNKLNAAKLNKLDSAQLNKLSTPQLKKLKSTAITKLNDAQKAKLAPEKLKKDKIEISDEGKKRAELKTPIEPKKEKTTVESTQIRKYNTIKSNSID